MKKLLASILVIALALVGLVVYQHQKVVGQLKNILKGKTYELAFVELEIPATQSPVKGWLHPTASIPYFNFKIKIGDFVKSARLESAQLSQDLWGKRPVRLEIFRNLQVHPKIQLQNPAWELSQEVISNMQATALIVQPINQKNEVLKLSSPQVKISPPIQKSKGTSSIRLEALTVTQAKTETEAKDQEVIRLGPMEFGVFLDKEEEREQVKVYTRGQGGKIQSQKAKAKLGGWDFSIQSSGRPVEKSTEEKLNASVKEVIHGLSKKSTQSFSGNSKLLLKALENVSIYIRESDSKIERQELRWQGMQITEKDGVELRISPLQFWASFSEANNKLQAKAGGELDEIFIKSSAQATPVVLSKISLDQLYEYEGLRFSNLLEYMVAYYQIAIQSAEYTLNPSKIDQWLSDYLRYMFVQYPDTGEIALNVGSLAYENDQVKGDHKNLNFKVKLEPKQFSYGIGLGTTDFQWKKDPEKSIEGGQGQLTVTGELPWQEWLSMVRKSVQEKQEKIDLVKPFLENPLALQLQVFLDLGKKYFKVDTRARIGVPKGKTIIQLASSSARTVATGDKTKINSELSRQLAQELIEKGEISYQLKIERFEKMQKALDKLKPGASLAFVPIIPYAKMDSDKDQLEVELELKQGKLLVNEKPNPGLEKMLQPFFDKLKQPEGDKQ